MEIRTDYLKSETIVYSLKRSKRPHNYNINKTSGQNNDFPCPFCKENANLTGETIIDNVLGSRIVKNIYPVVDNEFGVHDVAIESPIHELQLKDMSIALVYNFLQLMQSRAQEVSLKDNIKNVQVFKNSGPISGATLEHSHWQIVSTNVVPHKNKIISNNFTKYFEETKGCFLCNENEVIKVKEDDNMIFSIPKAGCGNINFRIFPKRHVSTFLELETEELKSLAEYIITSANILSEFKDIVSFNIIFFSEAVGENNENFHFFVDVIERMGTFGGFELATGDYINSVLPEELYKELKNKMEV